VKQIEQATRGQRLCKRWQQERQFRLTASKFGIIIKRRRNHTALVKQLLYTKAYSGGVAALVWGQQHEPDALDAYKGTLGSDFSVREAGIYLGDCGFLGASPDGVVNDHSGDSVRIVEVKCPYKAREKTLDDMYSDTSFCLSLDDGVPTLKKNHEYFYQIQGQMAMTGIHICDFVVWTPFDFIVITVLFDRDLWNKQC
jgi:hypothetical protein